MAATRSAIRPLRSDAVISFLTDVEGNLDYFKRFVQRSRVIRFGGAAPAAEAAELPPLEFREDVAADGAAAAGAGQARGTGYFVFGGDVCDKGVGDIRIARALTDFKRRYPDRVFLILGNRDVNKLRFTSELDPAVVADEGGALNDPAYPYWVEPAKRVTPAAFLAAKQLPNTRVNRLRWMLAETMGAAGTFETRQAELAALAGKAPSDVPDEAVLESFVTSVTPGHPDAFMRAYLAHGQLALVLGPHLFVHGALTPAALGRVPGHADPIPAVDAWAEALNAWVRAQLDEHAARPRWGPARGSDRGGDALMDYGVPGGFGGAGVVYATNLDNGNAVPVPAAVQEYLRAQGVPSVVCGHVPHGDCPTVIRSDGVRVITADTSYSDMGQPDNRGIAVAEVLLLADGAALVHGQLKDGREIEYRLPPPGAAVGGDPWVGRLLVDGFFVKARLAAPPHEYLLCKGEGFRLTVKTTTAADLEKAQFL